MKENTQYNTGDPRRYDPEFIELYKGSEIPWNNQNGLFSNRINIKSGPNRLNEINQIASKFDRDIDKIIDMLHSVNHEHDTAIREANHQGYRIGFNAGFQKADEIYIVQDMDIMKMQETTLFLRELKNRSINMSKIRIIINKYVKSKLTPKMLIQGLTYYNDPQMSFVDELLDNKVQYYIIPFNVENYSRYIDGLYNNNIEYKKYTPDFLNAIEAISNDVYRRANKGNTKRRGLFG